MVKRYKGLTSVTTSFLSILVASVLPLPAAVATAPSAMPGTRALLAVLALGVIGTALAFVIFYKLISETGAGRASLVSYLAPGSRSSTARCCSTRRSPRRRSPASR